MKLTKTIAQHVHDVHFGGNWTDSNLADQLADVSWREATASVHGLQSIAALTFHINYFVRALSMVLRGEPLDANDRFSFDVPPIGGDGEWQAFRAQVLADAEHLVRLLPTLDDAELARVFVDPKYGSYYRNLHGVIEHAHYHLGQIALIKRLVRASESVG